MNVRTNYVDRAFVPGKQTKRLLNAYFSLEFVFQPSIWSIWTDENKNDPSHLGLDVLAFTSNVFDTIFDRQMLINYIILHSIQ